MFKGRTKRSRGRRRYEAGREPSNTTVGERRVKHIRVRGGKEKVRLVADRYADVIIDKKPVKCEILSVVENSANKDFIRRNIITKGAILKAMTSKGEEIQIKITSRPGQDGLLNAVSLL